MLAGETKPQRAENAPGLRRLRHGMVALISAVENSIELPAAVGCPAIMATTSDDKKDQQDSQFQTFETRIGLIFCQKQRAIVRPGKQQTQISNEGKSLKA